LQFATKQVVRRGFENPSMSFDHTTFVKRGDESCLSRRVEMKM
jgi:hypothetical protein